MNACDHPHGGGRGKSKGNKDPRSVWGWLTKGKRTRRPKDRDGNKASVNRYLNTYEYEADIPAVWSARGLEARQGDRPGPVFTPSCMHHTIPQHISSRAIV